MEAFQLRPRSEGQNEAQVPFIFCSEGEAQLGTRKRTRSAAGASSARSPAASGDDVHSDSGYDQLASGSRKRAGRRRFSPGSRADSPRTPPPPVVVVGNATQQHASSAGPPFPSSLQLMTGVTQAVHGIGGGWQQPLPGDEEMEEVVAASYSADQIMEFDEPGPEQQHVVASDDMMMVQQADERGPGGHHDHGEVECVANPSCCGVSSTHCQSDIDQAMD